MPGMPVFQDSPSSLKTQFFGYDGASVVSIRTDNNGRIVITNEVGQTIDVSSTDLDIRDLTNTTDSVAVYGSDGSNNLVLQTDNTGKLVITNASGETIDISATDLDIRDISNTSDSIAVYGSDGSSNLVLQTDNTGKLVITNASGETIDISATDLDIRDISNTSDSIVVYGNDGSNNVVLKTDSSGVLETNAYHSFVDNNLGSVTSTDSYQYVTGQDISNLASYAFFVNNTGANDATIIVQLSPDNTTWVDDGNEITLAAGEATIVNASKFLKYIRMGYISTTSAQSTDLNVIFQGQS